MTKPSSLRTHDLLGRSRPQYKAGATTVHHDPTGLRRVTKAMRGGGRRVVLVPTMGALHDGHRELMRRPGGRYAELFTLQAAGYADPGDGAVDGTGAVPARAG